MKIKEISYLHPIQNNECVDVCVTLENNGTYLIEVTTPQFLSKLMKKSKSNFVLPGYPYIIVSKLTDEIIRNAIQEFMNDREDSYWLKLYLATSLLKIEELNEILDRKAKENAKFNEELKKLEEECGEEF